MLLTRILINPQITPKPGTGRSALDAITGRKKASSVPLEAPPAPDPHKLTAAAEYLLSKRDAIVPHPEPLHVASSRALQDFMTQTRRQSRDDNPMVSSTSYLDMVGSAGSESSLHSVVEEQEFMQELEAGVMSDGLTSPAWLANANGTSQSFNGGSNPLHAFMNPPHQPQPTPSRSHQPHNDRIHRQASQGSLGSGSDYGHGDDESYSNDSSSEDQMMRDDRRSNRPRQPYKSSSSRRAPPPHYHNQMLPPPLSSSLPTTSNMDMNMIAARENFRPPVPPPSFGGMPPDPFASTMAVSSGIPADPFAGGAFDSFLAPSSSSPQPRQYQSQSNTAMFQMDSFFSPQQPSKTSSSFAPPMMPGLHTIHSDSEPENGGGGSSHRQRQQQPVAAAAVPPAEERKAKIEKERTMAGFSRRAPNKSKNSHHHNAPGQVQYGTHF